MQSSRATAGMAYLLSEVLLVIIARSGNMLYERMSLTMFMVDTTYAMVIDNPDAIKKVNACRDILREVHRAYHPALDSNTYAAGARITFEQSLDDVLREILVIIYTENLINPSVLAEVKAKTWTA